MVEPMAPPDPPLGTDEFLLRPWRPDDFPAVLAAGADDAITAHTFMRANPDDDYAKRWARRAAEAWERGGAMWALVDRSDPDRCLGRLGWVRFAAPAGNAEIAYWLLPEARGRGWMATAVRLVTDWGFEHHAIERMFAMVDLDNTASQRTAEKAGLQREGILRGYEDVPGRGRVDLWSFARLATDP